MTVKSCQPCVLRIDERELFGGRVGARSLGGEPVMRAERVRSVRSSAVAAAEGGGRSSAVRAVRPFKLVGMHDGAVCEGVWGRRSYPSGPVARWMWTPEIGSD